ncbi:MAG: hypothetical protein V3S08_05480 [Phycisphaerales bacterium]
MPLSWTAIVRVVVLLLMAAHVFYFYAFARAPQEIVGVDFAAILASSAFALVMLVPLAWAVVLPDLPEIVRNHRARGRWQRGRCSSCNYLLLYEQGANCPECGTSRDEPGSFQFGWSTVQRFVLLAAAAWIVGCIGAESWAVLDEVAFAREGEMYVSTATTKDAYSRPRRWPSQDQTLYFSSRGVTAFAPQLVLDQPPVYSGLSTK